MKISIEKYDEMAKAYFDVQSVNSVSKTCNVNHQTARRYIEDGDPKRGLPPIRQRFLDLQRKVHRDQERTWERAMKESRGIVKRVKLAITSGVENLDRVTIPQALSLGKTKTLVETMDKLVRTESFLFGGPDQRIESTGDGNSAFADWTDDELRDYAITGRRPARLSKPVENAGARNANQND